MPSDKEAAEGRVAERNEELARLQTQIAKRARPALERIKDILKKYGVTVTAIFLAAGAIIGAVITVVTNASKATGKALGDGLITYQRQVDISARSRLGSVALRRLPSKRGTCSVLLSPCRLRQE